MRTPAEFEPHSSVWMAWPKEPEFTPGRPLEPVLLDVIGRLAPYVPVELAVRSRREASRVRELLVGNAVPSAHVRLRIVPDADLWIRDFGPAFVLHGPGRLLAVDFGFDGWGYRGSGAVGERTVRELEGVDRSVARELGLAATRATIVSEGGAREVNGLGTMLAVEALERQRNPGLAREAIEAEYRRLLGVTNVVWLEQGLVSDQHVTDGPLPGRLFPAGGPGGHVDEFARFAGPRHVLLADATERDAERFPVLREERERTEAAFRVLSSATDQAGAPLELIRVPIPDPIVEEVEADPFFSRLAYGDGTVVRAGSRVRILLSASYLNFLVTNGAVLVPAYWHAGRPDSTLHKDRAAQRALCLAFPGRIVVPVDVEALNHGGGGLHCATLPQPASAP